MKSDPDREKISILIIEYDHEFRVQLRNNFESLALEVATAATAAQALVHVATKRPSVIVVGTLKMMSIDEFITQKSSNSSWSNIPLIRLSDYVKPGNVLGEGSQRGTDDLTALNEAVRKVVAAIPTGVLR